MIESRFIAFFFAFIAISLITIGVINCDLKGPNQQTLNKRKEKILKA